MDVLIAGQGVTKIESPLKEAMIEMKANGLSTLDLVDDVDGRKPEGFSDLDGTIMDHHLGTRTSASERARILINESNMLHG